uniref:ATP synthase F0 subunit 6 n=1 Tax=Leptomastidea bifasciata TaxID=1880993 RepID=UPI002E79E735|nr:ATP synthase F0 subunit 6 [Leptomastidea bifasciata]WPT46956.1 ATP synthase F0 subunit 6 [Leptomastidea bifasciata]
MMNLFSVFDPCSSLLFSLNWISSIYVILFMPMIYWFIPSRLSMFYYKIFYLLSKEFNVLLNNLENKFNLILMLSLFMMIFLNNFLGMFSYIFTSSSHLVMSLSLSMSLWLMMMLFGWLKNSNHMFAHLVPQGTPGILMPFMVIVESLSNMIRSGTLSVRLSANMIAGHLLMTLISSTGTNLSLILLILMILCQSILIILELSVSVIQAYVFSVLSTLYSSEVNYE